MVAIVDHEPGFPKHKCALGDVYAIVDAVLILTDVIWARGQNGKIYACWRGHETLISGSPIWMTMQLEAYDDETIRKKWTLICKGR